jgi:hypothetical protein
MAENKTRPTDAQPVMWGGGIVGFDSYHYKYASGRGGDAALAGFSSRKGGISIYLSRRAGAHCGGCGFSRPVRCG